MAFSYDLTTNIGKVRLLIADTVEDGAVYEDEELTVLLTMEGNVLKAAAARALAPAASGRPTTTAAAPAPAPASTARRLRARSAMSATRGLSVGLGAGWSQALSHFARHVARLRDPWRTGPRTSRRRRRLVIPGR